MFLFNIEVVPRPNSPHAQEFGGAYVHCLIDFPQENGAEVLARYYLENEGWQSLQTEEVRVVEREDYADDDPDYLRYYDEAAADGACFIYHRWPLDADAGG
jgi:hypothetical protein